MCDIGNMKVGILLVGNNTKKKLQMIHIWCNFTSKNNYYGKTKHFFYKTK